MRSKHFVVCILGLVLWRQIEIEDNKTRKIKRGNKTVARRKKKNLMERDHQEINMHTHMSGSSHDSVREIR
jgi:hypothetical protein